ncbi:hypothetical protein CVT26_013163, partial [Gymnopilus dilepis]
RPDSHRKTRRRQRNLWPFSTLLVNAGRFWRSCKESDGRRVCENERTSTRPPPTHPLPSLGLHGSAAIAARPPGRERGPWPFSTSLVDAERFWRSSEESSGWRNYLRPQEASLVVYRPPQQCLTAPNSQHASVSSRGSKSWLETSKHQHEIEPVSTPLTGPTLTLSPSILHPSLRSFGRSVILLGPPHRVLVDLEGGNELSGPWKVGDGLPSSYGSHVRLRVLPSPPRSRRLGRRQRALGSLEGGGRTPFVLREPRAAAGVVGCGGAVGSVCEAGEVVGMRMGGETLARRPHRAKGVAKGLRLDTWAFLYTLCWELGGLWSSEALRVAFSFSSNRKKTASSWRFWGSHSRRASRGAAGTLLDLWLEDTAGARIAGVGLWDRLALAWTISVRPTTSLPLDIDLGVTIASRHPRTCSKANGVGCRQLIEKGRSTEQERERAHCAGGSAPGSTARVYRKRCRAEDRLANDRRAVRQNPSGQTMTTG